MEDRIRQILEDQMSMSGQGYGTHKGAIKAAATRKRRVIRKLGGDAANRRAAARSPWINFLKEMSEEYGIPYNEAMVDPELRKMYREMQGGSIVGGSANCWTKFRHREKPLPKSKTAVRKEYKKYLLTDKCRPKKSKYKLPKRR